jgi:hypothetical protein
MQVAKDILNVTWPIIFGVVEEIDRAQQDNTSSVLKLL